MQDMLSINGSEYCLSFKHSFNQLHLHDCEKHNDRHFYKLESRKFP